MDSLTLDSCDIVPGILVVQYLAFLTYLLQDVVGTPWWPTKNTHNKIEIT